MYFLVSDRIGYSGSILSDCYDVAAWLRHEYAGVDRVPDLALHIEHGGMLDLIGELEAYLGLAVVPFQTKGELVRWTREAWSQGVQYA